MGKKWTSEEEEILKETYEHFPKPVILARLERSWSAIWNRALARGLHRDKDIVKQEMIEGGGKRY